LLPSAPTPTPCSSPRAHPSVPPSDRSGARCLWLPAAGRAPGARASSRRWGCLTERSRGTAAVGNSSAIIAAGCAPGLKPQKSGAILLLTTNFSGGRWRQRCRASHLPRRRRRRGGTHLEPARECSSSRPLGRAGRAPPWPGPRLGALGPDAARAGLRTVPAGLPAARAAPTSAAAAPRLISGPARTRPAAARLAAQPPVAIAMSPPPHMLLTAIG
jgi:hypothetical protein